jgi:hypothetical protein
MKLGKLDDAMKRIETAIAAEPTLTRSHEIKHDNQNENKDFAGALATMNTHERDHGFRNDEAKLSADPRLAGLVASPEFAKWQAERQ